MTKLKRKMIDRVLDVVTTDPLIERLRETNQDKLENFLAGMPESFLLKTIPENEHYLYR